MDKLKSATSKFDPDAFLELDEQIDRLNTENTQLKTELKTIKEDFERQTLQMKQLSDEKKKVEEEMTFAFKK